MENNSPNESSPLTSFLSKGNLEDANKSDQEKVVLNDECGDSLWDDVLAQADEALKPTNSIENKEIPDKNDEA